MRTGNKSILADVLTEKVRRPESVTLQVNVGLFIDGFGLVAATGKPEKAKTCSGFTDCYVDAVCRKCSGLQRIDVFFDHYRRHSIKATIRKKRGSFADEVESISGTRRQQSGLSIVSLRRTYSASTC